MRLVAGHETQRIPLLLASVTHEISLFNDTTRPLCSLDRAATSTCESSSAAGPKSAHSLSMSLKFEGETSASASASTAAKAIAMKRHSNAGRNQLGGGVGGTDGHRGGGGQDEQPAAPQANRRGRKGEGKLGTSWERREERRGGNRSCFPSGGPSTSATDRPTDLRQRNGRE